jgi:hypothetical protein
VIRCWELSNLGRLLADGAQGEDAPAGRGSGGGGGSGGGILIEAEHLGEGGAGALSARGGRGGNAGACPSNSTINTRGGGGGHGRVRIVTRSSLAMGSSSDIHPAPTVVLVSA